MACGNQCSIPVFDGLLSEPHNTVILHLLFLCAHWHGLAKLRMHSDTTLDIMDEVTTALGQAFRTFGDEICSAYNTKELPKEANARRRRQAPGQNANPAKTTRSSQSGRIKKTFNLRTYKYHALGDYSQTIRRLGTTDSYSTAIVSIIKAL